MLRTVGMEIEMQMVQDQRGRPSSHETTRILFENLCRKYGYTLAADRTTNSVVGVKGAPYGYIDPDNSVANLEVSFKPTKTIHDMNTQFTQARGELKECAPGLSFLSLSRQPVMSDDAGTYEKYVCRKGIYPVVRLRGWEHRVGLTTSSTQPCIGVSLQEAICAVNCLQALSCVFIGLFANSPIFMGRETGKMESRADTWNQFMATSRFPNDRMMVGLPERKFYGWPDYLQRIWNHTPPFLPDEGGTDYKKSLCLIPDDPMSMQDFLGSQSPMPFRVFNGTDFTQERWVRSSGFHVDKGFWWAFWAARIRAELDPSIPPP